MVTRAATSADWEKLERFFKNIYRKNHPLHSREFWEWQYGDEKQGRSFICIDDQGEVVGHVGANFGGGLAWIINVYLTEAHRGKGILGKLYDLARAYYPLAATAANKAGLGLYLNMRWIRYYDLVRYVKINPAISEVTFDKVCKGISVNIDDLILKETHYLKQPSIKGIRLNGNATAVSQQEVGGLRLISFENLKETEEHAWALGYSWIDYLTSWNDLKTKAIEKEGWVLDFKSVVPWRLNPVEENYFCDITFLSELPLDNEFIVERAYSDHGRIGSL